MEVQSSVYACNVASCQCVCYVVTSVGFFLAVFELFGFDCTYLKHALVVSLLSGGWKQVLASALNANLFPFVLDLACLAAKREFLKLDKWITDKIKDNQVRWDEGCISAKYLEMNISVID